MFGTTLLPRDAETACAAAMVLVALTGTQLLVAFEQDNRAVLALRAAAALPVAVLAMAGAFALASLGCSPVDVLLAVAAASLAWLIPASDEGRRLVARFPAPSSVIRFGLILAALCQASDAIGLPLLQHLLQQAFG